MSTGRATGFLCRDRVGQVVDVEFFRSLSNRPGYEESLGKLNSATLNVLLVASEDVCKAATDEENALLAAGYALELRIRPYVEGTRPRDDDYGKPRMTEHDTYPLRKVASAFTRAARQDISDPALRKPAKNCP